MITMRLSDRTRTGSATCFAETNTYRSHVFRYMAVLLNMLPLRGEQQATDNYPAKGTFLFVNSLFG